MTARLSSCSCSAQPRRLRPVRDALRRGEFPRRSGVYYWLPAMRPESDSSCFETI